ncbi:hypothetical protein ACIQUU_31980 [Streptomyces sp. NPDC101116]|uniref:hypothetical protein n=1 Tax=Streptomyces sp. NPDC101116 TaxID=3366107 RepID=UPI00380B63B7
MTLAATTAIIRATIQDATVAELLNRPGMTAHRIARALETEGYTITHAPDPDDPENRA